MKSKYMRTRIYQLFKEGNAKVLLAVIFLMICSIFYKEIELKRWQRCHYGVFLLQTPEKMVVNVAKELLHMEDMNPTTKETIDHINSLLNRAFDAFLSTNGAINDELRSEIQTFLHENDTDLIEDRQEAIRIKRYCINGLLALALVSDVDERGELINRVYDYIGWKNDKELTSTYIGIEFVRLLFNMQNYSMYHNFEILHEIEKRIRENKEYIYPQQAERCEEVIGILSFQFVCQ